MTLLRLGPLLVGATLGVFATGVVLLVDGHKSDTVLFFHQAAFVVWGAAFGIHFLAYLANQRLTKAPGFSQFIL